MHLHTKYAIFMHLQIVMVVASPSTVPTPLDPLLLMLRIYDTPTKTDKQCFNAYSDRRWVITEICTSNIMDTCAHLTVKTTSLNYMWRKVSSHHSWIWMRVMNIHNCGQVNHATNFWLSCTSITEWYFYFMFNWGNTFGYIYVLPNMENCTSNSGILIFF